MTLKTRTLLYAAICIGTVLANYALLRQLVVFALEHEYASHILLIPFLSAVLILRRRARIFRDCRSPILIRESASVIAITLLISGSLMGHGSAGAYDLSVRTFAVVTLWIGAFLISYGPQSFTNALFPLLLLFLMVPIPETMLAGVILFLQRGSAAAVAFLFNVSGTPFHRDGFVFALPRMSIEVAAECSGIRSSLALLVSCLIASYLMLETSWRRVVFVVVAVPMAMFKNAMRITVLSLLAIHFDMRIMGGDLHRKGGVVFFLMGLLFMCPILWVLRRSEREAASKTLRKPTTS